MSICIGIDTSNYTTSVAALDTTNNNFKSSKKLLPVPEGALGLRQSDAVFAHIKSLPGVYKEISDCFCLKSAAAIGVSSKPREARNSYMPCFLAGVTSAKLIAESLGIPCFEFSHQQGHILSVIYTQNRLELLKGDFLAWHLSGGTTELLRVTPSETGSFKEEKLGGTTDISVGQLIDRCGAMLGFHFPSGKEVDALALKSEARDFFPVRVRNREFSLSGMENKINKKHSQGEAPREIAGFLLRTISHAVREATYQAFAEYSEIPVVMTGGVSGSKMIKELFNKKGIDAVFARSEFASDNALGVAVYAAILSGGLEL